jgi:choline-sulfatase
MYDPDAMPFPTRLEMDCADRPRGYLDELWHKQATNAGADFQKLRANYAGNVTLIDDQIGEILEVITERGELENTIIVLTSDHGEMNGDHGLIYKTNFLNGAVRIPLIVATPEIAKSGAGGRVNSALVELLDVGATIVELSGGAIDYPQFAQSLCPSLNDPTHVHRTEALSEIHGELMIFDGRWKLAVNTVGEGYLLFDLQNDPHEQRNLIGLQEYQSELSRLRGRLLERLVGSQVSFDGHHVNTGYFQSLPPEFG